MFRSVWTGAVMAVLAMMSAVSATAKPFTIAVLPDTQNYVDYQHQRAEGFGFDAIEMLYQQTRYIADHAWARGGDIVFADSVGDVWQHATLAIDPGHAARGFQRAPNPFLDRVFAPTGKVLSVEIPTAVSAFRMIDGLMPFAVVPGNHDYDAMWTDQRYPPAPHPDMTDLRSLGVQHVGGLTNFTSPAAFGSDSPFFAGKDWYVAAHDGGADSAQLFVAGGYRFLHIGLQFNAPGASLRWAEEVLHRYPGLPTIVTTHDFLDPAGERRSDPAMDAHLIDPLDSSPEMVWDRLIRRNDQIFLVLCGHQHGQSHRQDRNESGHWVYQILADYQDRHQASLAAGAGAGRPVPLGDGWMRLMTFDLTDSSPSLHVRTYSTFYHEDAKTLSTYAQWYKQDEKPGLTDEAFLAQEDFVIPLDDFRARFGKAEAR